jgi:hypothetical protein
VLTLVGAQRIHGRQDGAIVGLRGFNRRYPSFEIFQRLSQEWPRDSSHDIACG